MKISSRKHWYSYTSSLFLIILIGIPIIVFYFISTDWFDINPLLRNGILIFGIWILFKATRRIILNSRIQWLFDDQVLTVKSGLLPWKKTLFEMDISQIYEIYYTNSFMGTLLGFGGLCVRRTDGVTSKIIELSMTNHKRITSAVNNSLSIHKKSGIQKPEQINSKESLPDELRKLADLNKDGVISDEEFEKLKNKLIN